jgi:uncharacterized protein YutE (UPF0331/DUF86 family)
MDDINRILSAVETIERSLGILADKRGLDRDEYMDAVETQDVVERRFVKMTEAALDIAETICKHERGLVPESNPATMRALADFDVLDADDAADMAKAARFRNVLAHTYGDVIDGNVVYDALQDLERYRAFLRSVHAYLDEAGAFEG